MGCPFFYFIADVDQSVYEPGLLTVDDALPAVAGNQSGNPRIGDSRTLPNDTPQLVAPLGFNDDIDIDTGRKSRPQGHGMTCHTPVRPQVLLGQDGIDDGPGLQRRNRRPFRIHQQGNGLASQAFRTSAKDRQRQQVRFSTEADPS